jgi:hypothetical protein
MATGPVVMCRQSEGVPLCRGTLTFTLFHAEERDGLSAGREGDHSARRAARTSLSVRQQQANQPACQRPQRDDHQELDGAA